MLAGGYGVIRPAHVNKKPLPDGCKIAVLGGPAMLIGLGGGAASSMTAGTSSQELDFASVQRDNAEIQRRCQEVIDQCWALGEDNPILSIHDVGAGGLSNALPELVHQGGAGAVFDLRAIHSADQGMSPMELWCNEAQERYVLAISAADTQCFGVICERERAPYAVIGETNNSGRLVVTDKLNDGKPVDVPLDVILGKTPGLSFKTQAYESDEQRRNKAGKHSIPAPTPDPEGTGLHSASVPALDPEGTDSHSAPVPAPDPQSTGSHSIPVPTPDPEDIGSHSIPVLTSDPEGTALQHATGAGNLMITLDEAIARVLQLPAVADKRFLVTIGDRSVSGLVVRDQMVGPLADTGGRLRDHCRHIRRPYRRGHGLG